MPACADINGSMQKLTGVFFETSNQHKDASHTRQARDSNDTFKLIYYLQDRDPFTQSSSSLASIATGITAKDGVNVDQAKYIWKFILDSMDEQSVDDFSLQKVDEAVPIGTNAVIKIHDEPVSVDP